MLNPVSFPNVDFEKRVRLPVNEPVKAVTVRLLLLPHAPSPPHPPNWNHSPDFLASPDFPTSPNPLLFPDSPASTVKSFPGETCTFSLSFITYLTGLPVCFLGSPNGFAPDMLSSSCGYTRPEVQHL